jgi:hypothetical protein
MIEIIIALIIGVIGGYYICAFATWNRSHQQESSIRALSVDIGILMDMGDEVPPEWVQDQLDSIVVKAFR